MGQNRATFEVSPDLPRQGGGSNCYDDDGRLKRTGTVWTASAHIITSGIGSGVLSLAWATAQLGWIAGPVATLLFSIVTYYISTILAPCYCSGDPVTGKRNHAYTDAVGSILGRAKAKLCGLVQYPFLFGVAIGYTIESSMSMTTIIRSSCFHEKGDKSPCYVSSNPYMIMFGVIQIFLSQIPNFDRLWWFSIVAAVMSFTYSNIGLALGIAKVAENGKLGGSLTGISIGAVTWTQKIWRSFQALGNIAFAYLYSTILIEIQDTIKSPPSEAKTMKQAMLVSVAVMTLIYMLCGCFGYAAFGDVAPGNLISGFGFFNPYWLIDIASAAVMIHLVCAYQVFSQPLFALMEMYAVTRFPNNRFITKENEIPVRGLGTFKLNGFRLIFRTTFVIVTTMISMLLPFFNEVIGFLGALGFWPLTVYFPVEMYIAQMEILRWSTKWIGLQILSIACLIISFAAAVGSIAGVMHHLKSYKPFGTNY